MLLLGYSGVVTAADSVWVDASSTAAAPDGSRARPYLRITDALQHVAPGGTVLVQAGVYREHVTLRGTKRMTLSAAPGARAVISGLRPVTGWRAVGNGLFSVTLKWRPRSLFVGYRAQPLAREPNDRWWAAAEAGGDVITDPVHVRKLPRDLTGAAVYIWVKGNVYFTLPILAVDPVAGTVRVKLTSKWAKLQDGDRYWLQNHPTFIDRSGEWAVVPRGDEFEVLFRPAQEKDLAKTQAQWSSGNGISLRNAEDVRISGLDVIGWERCGLEVMECRNVTVTGCRAAMNGRSGIIVRASRDCTVANNLVSNNGVQGIAISYSDNIQVCANEIAFNRVDGLIVAWKTRNVTVKRNYIHHHLWWGHPDNIQMYRDVENVRFVDNLLLAGGQTVMMEQCHNLEFRGNMMVGSNANMLIFGHGSAGDAVVEHNTLAYAGYSCISLTASRYKLLDNVFMLGHDKVFYSIRGIEGFAADRNLYWAGPKATASIASDKGWHRTFAAYRQANAALDKHSTYADPGFVNAPIAFGVVDAKELPRCTRRRLFLRGGTKSFRVGQYVEINFDGSVRRVTACDDNAITVAPPLPAAPIKGWLVANWGAKNNFALDLRLKSAGKRKSPAPGACIDISAYRHGDFDGDGRRDIPDYPDDWGRDARMSPKRSDGNTRPLDERRNFCTLRVLRGDCCRHEQVL